jgi:nucleoside-diphosphate-sugar epimerase
MSFAPPPPRLVVVGATGWYGKTLVHEYVLAYGARAAADNLLLYASRPSLLSLEIKGRSLKLPVADLAEAPRQSLGDFDGLLWYAFILKNKLPAIGAEAYRIANERIATHVFDCLSANPHLRTAFFSSGAAYGLTKCPAYEDDPYAHLKIHYERKLSRYGPLVTIYPYATLGKYVPDHFSFAAASFIYQAITTGRIVIEAKNPVVRSYGSVHDFSRLLLRLFEHKHWTNGSIPYSIVPVTHTLELIQLAHEVAAALEQEIDIINSIDINTSASVYITSDFSYGAQLSRFGLVPSGLTQQLRDMMKGRAFLSAHE